MWAGALCSWEEHVSNVCFILPLFYPPVALYLSSTVASR